MSSTNDPSTERIILPQPFLQEYFSTHDGFTYDHTKPPSHEFHRLAKSSRWDPRTKEREIVGFRKALERQFNSMYGRKENHAQHWQGLCRLLNIFPVPQQLDHCREMFLTVFVNVIDLIHLPQSQEQLRTFETVEDLAEYTKESGRYFPTRRVQIGGIIGCLLRHIKEIVVAVPSDDGNGRRENVPGAGPSRRPGAGLTRNQRRRRRRRERRAAAVNTTSNTNVQQVVNQLAAVEI